MGTDPQRHLRKKSKPVTLSKYFHELNDPSFHKTDILEDNFYIGDQDGLPADSGLSLTVLNTFISSVNTFISTTLPATYLRLDCANDPLTGNLHAQWIGINTDPSYPLHVDAATTPATVDTVYIHHSTSVDNVSALTIESENTKTTGIVHMAQDVYVEQTNVVTAGANSLTGINVGAYKTGADTNAAVTTVAAIWAQAGQTGSTNVGTHYTYGGYFQSVGDANGTSIAYGIYAAATGADNNWSGFFANNIGISGSTSGIVTIQTAAAAGTWTLTLPTNDGTNPNDVLVTDSFGVTSWIAASGLICDHSTLINRDIAGNHAKLIPSADSTTALQITKADGTTVILNSDSTNRRIGINSIAPTSAFEIKSTSGTPVVSWANESSAVLTGVGNTLAGVGSGVALTDGTYNTTLGYQCLNAATENDYNIAMGYRAMYNSANTADYNIAGGYYAARYVHGDYNIAWGYSALYGAVGSSANSTYNIAIGYRAMYSSALNDSRNNIAIGRDALFSATSANYNCAYGYAAAYSNTTGGYNFAMGYSALAFNQTGTGNVALGSKALYGVSLTSYSYNTGIGYFAGAYETASYKLFIDNIDRTTEALGRSNSLIYGVFNATPANQFVAINGELECKQLTAGRVVFSTAGTVNPKLTDDADFTFLTDTLTVTKIIGSTQITTPAIRLTSSTPAALGGDVNDWDVGNKSFIRASGGAGDRIITGILSSGVADGHIMIITNIGTTNKLSFSNESGSSAAANRIMTSSAGTVEVPPAHTIQLIYDGTSSRWREMSHL